MKANELRIGNYISCWIKSRENDFKDYQIEEIGKTCIDNKYYVVIDDSFCVNSETGIAPIPLTEEWLIKFGFKTEQKNKSLFIIKCDEYVMRVSVNTFSGNLENSPFLFVSVLTGYASRPVTIFYKYVHQLQNLYFALTGKELKIKE